MLIRTPPPPLQHEKRQQQGKGNEGLPVGGEQRQTSLWSTLHWVSTGCTEKAPFPAPRHLIPVPSPAAPYSVPCANTANDTQVGRKRKQSSIQGRCVPSSHFNFLDIKLIQIRRYAQRYLCRYLLEDLSYTKNKQTKTTCTPWGKPYALCGNRPHHRPLWLLMHQDLRGQENRKQHGVERGMEMSSCSLWGKRTAFLPVILS